MYDRTILCVSGPDAKSFLQNLVTNDVTKLSNDISVTFRQNPS